MKRFLTFCAIAIITFSPTAYATAEKHSAEKKNIKEAVYRHTGGKIKDARTQSGKIVWVNSQTSIPSEWIDGLARYFAEMIHVHIETASGKFSFPDAEIKGNATLYIIDDNTLPPILHAPESRWTMVNIARLKEGAGARPAFFEARVKKEIVRGFCMLAGTQKSNYPQSLLGAVTKPSDLDQFPDYELPVDIPTRFHEYLSGFGIRPYRLVTYKKACQEGWAPPPTNDVQRVIWNQIHSVPDKPIKIEFDPKKDK